MKELEAALQMEQLHPATLRGLEQAQRRSTSFEALQVGLHITVELSLVQALNGDSTLWGLDYVHYNALNRLFHMHPSFPFLLIVCLQSYTPFSTSSCRLKKGGKQP